MSIFAPAGTVVIPRCVKKAGKDVTYTVLAKNAKQLAIERSIAEWHLSRFGVSLDNFKLDGEKYSNDILPMETPHGAMYQNLLETVRMAYGASEVAMPTELTSDVLWDVVHGYMVMKLTSQWTAEDDEAFGGATKLVPGSLEALRSVDELMQDSWWMTAWIAYPTLEFLFRAGKIPLDTKKVFDALQFPVDRDTGLPLDKDRPEAHARFRALIGCAPEEYALFDDNRFVHEARAQDGGVFGVAPMKPGLDPALFAKAKEMYHANGGTLHVLPSTYEGYTFERE